MLKQFYYLTKPGIVYGNALAAIAGFLMASKWRFSICTYLAMIAGLSLIIASACVFNNYIDRDIDKLMARTKRRALVQGTIKGWVALVYGAVLGLLGGMLLILYTNILTALVAGVGFVVYVFIYDFYKRRTVHGTVIGSISGAVPPVVGYCAVTNRLDAGGWILFAILVFWQMPHFYTIALYRYKDYAAASIPALPVKNGAYVTKIQVLIYTVAFTVAALALTLFGYTGYIYAAVMAMVGIVWFVRGVRGFRAVDNTQWGRKMFLFSLIALMVTSVMIAVGPLLP